MAKKKEKLENKNNQYGITLIALVITIIVLLILAGVTIATLTGENGILKQAENAKEKTKQAEKTEGRELQKVAESIEGVTQVTDQTPGMLEGEGTEENPYKIQSIEDLVVFAYEVTNGRTFLKEDGTKEYVELSQSLDFEDEKSYIEPYREDYEKYEYSGKLKEVLNQSGFHQIGINVHEEAPPKNIFCGVFDGNGYVIYNLKLQQEIDFDLEEYITIGMFSNNGGIIKNIGIEKSNVNAKIGNLKFSLIGLLAGGNYGEIKNCYTTGELTCEMTKFSCNIGGLVGGNAGQIHESYNKANVTTKITGITTTQYQARVGGITGINDTNASIIKNSYNTGKIYVESNIMNFIGGIAGYNIGEINTGYNIGIISSKEQSGESNNIGSIVGNNSLKITNVYYLENTVFPANENTQITLKGEKKTNEEMKLGEFVEVLNSGSNDNVWVIHNTQNDGYPILSWKD